MAFGFGIPRLSPASANPEDDAALSPELLALLRAQRLGADDAPAPQGLAPGGGAAGQGQGSAPPASRPFGFVSPLARASASDDELAATPPGFSGFSPSPTPTGGATPMLAAGLPSLGSVMKGMEAGARGSGETLTDTGQRIGAMVGSMAGRSADLVGKLGSGEIAPGAFLGAAARRAGETVRSAVTAPRDAYTGDLQVFDPATGHVSDEAMGRAGAAAGLAMTGSLPFGVPAGALRTFGGRTAATADRAALDRAAGMQASGASPDAIWRDTGWGLGRDGAARFEIPDDAARLRPHDGAPATLLGSVLDHPALFEAYPGMRDVNVFHRPELGADAAANPARNWIALNLDDPQALQGLLHEGQHIVQRREGFAPGASPIDPAMAAHPQVAEAGALRQRLAGLDAPEAVALADRTDQAARLNAYRTAAGEVEARNVEARQGMTPVERRAKPPWQTQDVPSDRQWLPRPAGDGVTGDAAQLKLGAGGQGDPLAALEGALGAVKPETPVGLARVDPAAASWDLYHGTAAPQDFARFRTDLPGTMRPSTPASEAGGVFLSPSADEAAVYAGGLAGREGTAGAGPRVIRATVEPGRTDVFDVPHLMENDPAFVARARQVFIDDAGGREAAGHMFDVRHARMLDEFRQTRDLNTQLAEMGHPPTEPTVPWGFGGAGAAMQAARERGLDTAVIRGLGESGGGDQVVALTPGRVRSRYSPDQLLYGGAAAAAGGAALGAPGNAEAASGSYADRVGHAESAGKATAKNPRSSATGYGQFIDSTWLDMMGKYRPDLAGSLPKAQLLALRNDPALSREMIARYGDENGAKLRAAGLPDNDGTRYLSHFAGPKGARAILKADPSVPAAQVLDPGQVSANPFVRKMTAGQLADWAAKKVGGSAPTMTMPDAPSRPAAFGLGGPTQVRAPASGTAPASPAPLAGPTSATPDIDALLAVLAKNKSGGGGLGFASGGGGESRPEGDGGSILSRQAPRRRPFAFMRPMQFAGLKTPIPQRRTTR